MTLNRRDGRSNGWWSDGRRDDKHGGEIPIEWNARCVDLDSLGLEIDGQHYLVGTDGKVWVQYDERPYRPVSLVFVCERKNAGENLGWGITRAIARKSGIPAYLIIKTADGFESLNEIGNRRKFPTLAAFVYATHVAKRSALTERPTNDRGLRHRSDSVAPEPAEGGHSR